MMEILSTELVNFQCHEHFCLELSEGITCITGPTDSGKTAIVRALYWVAFNRPTGTSFIRSSSKECSVRVVFRDCIVSRIKSPTDNAYVLKGVKLNAVGTQVPDVVAQSLQLCNLNFQLQHDPPLFSEGSKSMLELWSQVINQEALQFATDWITGWLRDISTQISATKLVISKAQQRYDELFWVDDAYDELQRIQSLIKHYKLLEGRDRDLSNALSKLQGLEREISDLASLVRASSQVLAALSQYCTLKQKYEGLVSMGQTLSQLENDILEKSDAVAKLTEVHSHVRNFISLAAQYRALLSHLNTLNTLRNNYDAVSKEHREIQKKLASIERCPICNKPLDSRYF